MFGFILLQDTLRACTFELPKKAHIFEFQKQILDNGVLSIKIVEYALV